MTLSRLSARERSRGLTDWMWGGLGLSIASVSASFAAYMIATAPSEVTGSGSKDWTVFVHFDRRGPALASEDRPPSRLPPATVTASAIDPEPTGSIETGGARKDSTTQPRDPALSKDLHDYVLQQVVGDRALIEHHNKLSLVQPGSVLDDAGEVLAIERRGNGWIVRTAAGIIGGT